MILPKDEISGEEHLSLGVPWITNDSILRLDQLLKPHYKALEFGSGGSTVFFAHRLKHVTSFETNMSWAKKVDRRLTEGGYKNHAINLYHTERDLEELVQMLFCKELYNVILVDSAWAKVNRDRILRILCDQKFEPSVLVLDNYASPRGNPLSFKMTEDEFETAFPIVKGMTIETFDRKGWAGKGTRIYHKEG